MYTMYIIGYTIIYKCLPICVYNTGFSLAPINTILTMNHRLTEHRMIRKPNHSHNGWKENQLFSYSYTRRTIVGTKKTALYIYYIYHDRYSTPYMRPDSSWTKRYLVNLWVCRFVVRSSLPTRIFHEFSANAEKFHFAERARAGVCKVRRKSSATVVDERWRAY